MLSVATNGVELRVRQAAESGAAGSTAAQTKISGLNVSARSQLQTCRTAAP
jgi:hypothetical protein